MRLYMLHQIYKRGTLSSRKALCHRFEEIVIIQGEGCESPYSLNSQEICGYTVQGCLKTKGDSNLQYIQFRSPLLSAT